MPELYETPEERIARLERKVENLEAWAAKVAPILTALQKEAQKPRQDDPYSAIENLLRGKRG